MFKSFLKKIIIASFLIYAFNIIAVNFNIVVPINVWTISYISMFDIPGLVVLVIIKTI